MPLTATEFDRLKRAVADKKSEADRAAGAYQQAVEQLKSEFKCNSLKEADALLTELEDEEAKATKQLEDELAAFKEKHGTVLGI